MHDNYRYTRQTCWQHGEARPFAAAAPSESYEGEKKQKKNIHHRFDWKELRLSNLWWKLMLPYTFMGIPPEGYHFVDLQSSRRVGFTASCPESAILHLWQEVFWERTANIVVVTILKHTNTCTHSKTMKINHWSNNVPMLVIQNTHLMG